MCMKNKTENSLTETVLERVEVIFKKHIQLIDDFMNVLDEKKVRQVQTEILFPTRGWTSTVSSIVTIEDVISAKTLLVAAQKDFKSLQKGIVTDWQEVSLVDNDPSLRAVGCHRFASKSTGLEIWARSQYTPYGKHIIGFETNGEPRVNIKIPTKNGDTLSARIDHDHGYEQSSASLQIDVGDGGLRRNLEDIKKIHTAAHKPSDIIVGAVLGAASTFFYTPQSGLGEDGMRYSATDRSFTKDYLVKNKQTVLVQKQVSPLQSTNQSDPARVPPSHHATIGVAPKQWVAQMLQVMIPVHAPAVYDDTSPAIERLREVDDRSAAWPGLRLLEDPAFSLFMERELSALIQKHKNDDSSNTPLTVVDFGCGPGHTLYDIAARLEAAGITNYRLVGIDASQSMLPREYKKTQSQNVQFYHETFDRADMIVRKADLVISRMALHYEDPKKAFAAVGRVAKPGARILVSQNILKTEELEADEAFPEAAADPRPRTIQLQMGAKVTVIEWLATAAQIQRLLTEVGFYDVQTEAITVDRLRALHAAHDADLEAWEAAIEQIAIDDKKYKKSFAPFEARYNKNPYCMIICCTQPTTAKEPTQRSFTVTDTNPLDITAGK